MKIIVHRGALETGGNCIELQAGRARLLLDYGAPLGLAEPGQARLPVPGLYEKSPDPLLAVLVSHSHATHYGGLILEPLKPGVDIFMSETMEEVVRINTLMPRDGRSLQRHIRHFRRGQKFAVGPFAVTPYLMDHTAAEAYAFLVEAEGKKVLYTGDYRDHGGKAAAFKQLLAANTGPLDALITEGTQADLDKGPTELDVMAQIGAKVKGNNGALYIMCAGQDLGLLTALAYLARNTRRYLVVDGYTALVLERAKALAQKQGVDLKIPGLETEYLRVIRNAATQRVYQLTEYTETFRRMREKMFGWDWVRANLRKLIIPVRAGAELWVAEQIHDFNNSTLLYSAWEAYTDELGQQATLQWLRGRGLTEVPMPVTGHAYFGAVKKLVEAKKPRNVLPINTAHAQKFAAAFGKKVRALRDGEELILD
jgi:ribonuclease J